MRPGKNVEVEASQEHDRVVGVLLKQYGVTGEGVPWKVGAVVARLDGREEGRRCRKQWDLYA